MTNELLNRVRERQKLASYAKFREQPRVHNPKMLYIGCSDARLDIVNAIGIQPGEALIVRMIAALVKEENTELGAHLEFFLREIPGSDKDPRCIVVAGHTDCGGIDRCLHGTHGENVHLKRYLSVLDGVRDEVLSAYPDVSDDRKSLALVEASVRQSVKNLKNYKVVQQALAKNEVIIEAWVIDTASKRIAEMDHQTGDFYLMGVPGKNIFGEPQRKR